MGLQVASEPKNTSESKVPRHIAIIMDGNGRWATKKNRPRSFGHRAGVEVLKGTIESCIKNNVECLSVFAFSSENWRRPEKEVHLLMELFLTMLKSQAKVLHNNNIKLHIIGQREAFSKAMQTKIKEVENLTHENTGLTLVIAANYGGQWDLEQASQSLLKQHSKQALAGELLADNSIEQHLSTYGMPEPDLFIRTGGEKRISNFFLWQLAYCELYFTDILWPDFDECEFSKALKEYSVRQRKFGHTAEQVQELKQN
ncbi:MAG: di-trans,poly-cis-decaprenylcistransferase [Cycloclasticus sp. symbiont of Poecilosclerida sp. M]|nr:MAG: di-trans,poly-cis-decaprenylcistransferase [Cycloclasticus sp. symbiont of Poecilosclerida sp. M]